MRDCEHGQLGRSCEICDLEEYNAQLKGEVGWLTFRLEARKEDIEQLLADLEQAKEELAKFVECEDSYCGNDSGEIHWEDGKRIWPQGKSSLKVYHKEGE